MDIGEYICDALYLGPIFSMITLVKVVPEVVLNSATSRAILRNVNHARSTCKSHFHSYYFSLALGKQSLRLKFKSYICIYPSSSNARANE